MVTGASPMRRGPSCSHKLSETQKELTAILNLLKKKTQGLKQNQPMPVVLPICGKLAIVRILLENGL